MKGLNMHALNRAAAKIVQETVAAVERPPRDFSRPYDLGRGLVSGAAMATLGVLGGSGMGIAAFGTAISGAWVLAPVLGLVGLLAGATNDDSK
jgi:hypothetical protein